MDDAGNFYKYFDCINGAGSFIKPNKVVFGRLFLDSLRDRYVEKDAPEISTAENKLPDAFVTTSKGNLKSIEFLGEKQLRYS